MRSAPPDPPPRASPPEVAQAILPRRDALLAAARHPTPFYAWDPEGFRTALGRFCAAFDPAVPRHTPHYAVKSRSR